MKWGKQVKKGMVMFQTVDGWSGCSPLHAKEHKLDKTNSGWQRAGPCPTPHHPELGFNKSIFLTLPPLENHQGKGFVDKFCR